MEIDILDELWKSRHPYDVLFLSIIEGYTLKESKDYPNIIFYMKDDKVLFQYELETKFASVNDKLIWDVFKYKFFLNHQEVKEIMRNMLETHIKIEGVRAGIFSPIMLQYLETQIKLKETTSIQKHKYLQKI